jgi:hypothetical protein
MGSNMDGSAAIVRLIMDVCTHDEKEIGRIGQVEGGSILEEVINL